MHQFDSKISVIIPYYQTNSEPLAKALNSIFSQRAAPIPNIIIVDDGSPVPADEIVNKYFLDKLQYIRIIHQPNSGAPVARNAGLDNLPESTEYVAFIDSDDEWSPDHLKNAIEALENGFDFYFADHKRSDWEASKFEQVKFDLSKHTPINRGGTLFKYNGSLLLPIVYDHLIQTSTVAFKLNGIKDLRFQVNLKVNDDEVFWIQASKRVNQIAFCKEIESYMGKGVNISQSSTRGSEKSFQLIYQNSLFWREICHLFPGEPELKQAAQYRINQLNKSMADDFLYRLKRRQHMPFEIVLKYTQNSPKWLFSLIKTIVKHTR